MSTEGRVFGRVATSLWVLRLALRSAPGLTITMAVCTLLAGAGYMLEDQYERISTWMNPLSTGIFVICIVAYVTRVVRQGHQHG